MDWCLYGDDKRKEMDRDLKPEYLLDDLRPEFLIDQIGKASNSSNFPSMTRAMERIADVVEEKWEEERE